MRRLVCCVLLTLVFLPVSVAAADACRTPLTDRPTVGLVLGGGGARGSAHIGVIRALEELRIPVDCVVGTSMGSLVGALYASGMSVSEMEETIGGIDWTRLFNDETSREDQPYRRKRDDEVFALFGPKIGIGEDTSLIATGLISGQNISLLFESLTSQREQVSHFDDLPLPFRAVAADLLTGEAVVIEEGSLALAMRASMSVPAVFDPVEWEGRLLVDGGIADNLPVDVARDIGADIVIAVDVGAGGLSRDEIRNVLSVVSQLTNLMVTGNVEASRARLTDQDALIRPALGDDIRSGDFAKSAQGAEIGYRSAMEDRDSLLRLSLPEADYSRYVLSLQEQQPSPPVIEFVRLDNQSQFSDEFVLRQLSVTLGEPLDQRALESDIRLIYGLGFLEMVRYEVVEDGARRGIELHVRQDSRGSEYIEWGLDLFADDLTNGFNLRLAWLKANLDQLGSEFRIATQLGREKSLILDLYKYLDRRAGFFVNPRLFAEVQELTQFIADEPTGVDQIELYGGDLAIGREFSRHAALSLGVRGFTGTSKTLIGVIGNPEEDFDGGELFVDWTYDRLDDRYFPDNGSFARMTYYDSVRWLGADDNYNQVSTQAIFAHSFGPHTLLGGIRADATTSGEAPDYALFQGGDLFQLSGFNPGQISGQNFGVATASYQYRIAGGFVPTRVGFSVEYGGVSDDWEDLFSRGVVHGSVFLGVRTPIGPAYLGYGFGERGLSRYFLKFGRVFGRPSVIR